MRALNNIPVSNLTEKICKHGARDVQHFLITKIVGLRLNILKFYIMYLLKINIKLIICSPRPTIYQADKKFTPLVIFYLTT